MQWTPRRRGRPPAGDRALRPGYDRESFPWLIARAAEKRMYGAFRRALVREPGGDVVGWYLAYFRPGGIAQVLQIGARPRRMREVLNCLFRDALDAGAVAISGGVDPRYTKELAASRCQLAWPDCAVLVHSRNREILNAIYRGDAFLSRLEGEWWARFSDPDWSVESPQMEPEPLGIDDVPGTPVRS
jgi:hypothetical protein